MENRERNTTGERVKGAGRKLTCASAEEKENTLVKYKGCSRFCNRVISRNPLFRACTENMCSSPCATKTRIDSSILTFHLLRRSLFRCCAPYIFHNSIVSYVIFVDDRKYLRKIITLSTLNVKILTNAALKLFRT